MFCKNRWDLCKTVKRTLPIGILPSALAPSRLQKIYEQGASKKRIKGYWRRWLGWVACCAGLYACPGIALAAECGTHYSQYPNHYFTLFSRCYYQIPGESPKYPRLDIRENSGGTDPTSSGPPSNLNAPITQIADAKFDVNERVVQSACPSTYDEAFFSKTNYTSASVGDTVCAGFSFSSENRHLFIQTTIGAIASGSSPATVFTDSSSNYYDKPTQPVNASVQWAWGLVFLLISIPYAYKRLRS